MSDEERFRFYGYEEDLYEMLKNFLEYYGYSYDAEKIKLLVDSLKYIYENSLYVGVDSHFDFEEEKKWPTCPSNSMCLMIPRTKYFINVKKSIIVALAFLIDILATKGATVLFLTLLGKVNKSIYKLNDEEFLILKKLYELNKNNECITLDDLVNKFEDNYKIEEIIYNLKKNEIITEDNKCLKISI